ncbi:cholinesterase precursor [Fusarium acutatum]|uniref:Cholinesterase n=1 Tax=Fusarium acutatum TaxID=78861 RepID=A0A8H4NJG3_9HYPO|nr:cholinesterase precursor [Fusarium acutatum]
MRYAAPPLGDLRFMPPQDPVRSVKQRTQTRLKCVSQSAKARFIGKSQSEDCLFLNVFAPSNASRYAKLPIFVYIQGGGFNDNSRPKINGADLIRASDMKMVVLTMNYRVSVLGFLSYGDKVQPNNGLLDPTKALEWWNKRRIKQKASSKKSVAPPKMPLLHADQDYRRIIAANINVPYPEGTQLPIGMWRPVIDGDFVRDALWNSFDQGKFVKVPSVIGATGNGGYGAPRSCFPGGINADAVNVVQGDVGSLCEGLEAQTGV